MQIFVPIEGEPEVGDYLHAMGSRGGRVVFNRVVTWVGGDRKIFPCPDDVDTVLVSPVEVESHIDVGGKMYDTLLQLSVDHDVPGWVSERARLAINP